MDLVCDGPPASQAGPCVTVGEYHDAAGGQGLVFSSWPPVPSQAAGLAGARRPGRVLAWPARTQCRRR